MTPTVALPYLTISTRAQEQLKTSADGRELQGSAFAVLLAALVGSKQDDLGLPQGRNSASPAPSREEFHEVRASEFLETGVFGLMGIGAVATGAEGGAATAQRVGPSLNTSLQRPSQQPHASDVALRGVVPEAPPRSATALPGALPRQRLKAPRLAHSHSRPQHVEDAASTTVQRRAESRSPALISSHRADQRVLLPASGQTNAVHVAITAAEHGLSVFARVGRMEPTERTRLRHAAALLLAQYGHHGATVTLDADVAEAKGGMDG